MERCEKCMNYSQWMSANSPQKLSALIKKVKCAVQAGIFVEINADKYSYTVPFEEVSAGGGWQDIIENEFKCTQCKSKYTLFADTYRGNKDNGWSPQNT